MVLNIGAMFMGSALTIRDLVGERIIFRPRTCRRAAGVRRTWRRRSASSAPPRPSQTVIMSAIVSRARVYPAAARSCSERDRRTERDFAATAVSCVLGLALSSVARSTEQILPMLVVVDHGSW